MRELSVILANSTRAIKREYFMLQIDGGDPVYRERVYCYELYHQMRLLWPQDSEYRLNGEVDKAGHAVLRALGVRSAKPDLLVHQPGRMRGNHAILEVKPPDESDASIQKDLEVLSEFSLRAHYHRAIYLMYGEQNEREIIARVREIARGVQELANIELWLHLAVEVEANQYALIGPNQLD